MKYLKSLSMLCLFGMLAFCSGRGLAANGSIPFLPSSAAVAIEGCPHSMTGTATYAFNLGLTGTTSSDIDLGLVGCFSFSITQTAGSFPVYLWSSTSSSTSTLSTSTAQIVAQVLPGNYSLEKIAARYYFFTIGGQQGPSSLTYTPTASTTSIFYWLPSNWPY